MTLTKFGQNYVHKHTLLNQTCYIFFLYQKSVSPLWGFRKKKRKKERKREREKERKKERNKKLLIVFLTDLIITSIASLK